MVASTECPLCTGAELRVLLFKSELAPVSIVLSAGFTADKRECEMGSFLSLEVSKQRRDILGVNSSQLHNPMSALRDN